MLNKKLMILAIFIVLLLAVSVVSAADNGTDDVVSMEEKIDNSYTNELINQEFPIENSTEDSNNFNSDEGILSSVVVDEKVSLESDDEILGDTLQYNVVSGSNPSILYVGSSGTFQFGLYPKDSTVHFSYNIYLDFYKTGGSLVHRAQYSGNTNNIPSNIVWISCNYGNTLDVGSYTLKVTTTFDGSPLATHSFTVEQTYSGGYTNPSDYDYCSVNVNDMSISSGASGTILFTVSCRNGYNFDLKIFNSNNVEKITKHYYRDSGCSNQRLEYTIHSNVLTDGFYTIKIINTKEGIVLDSAKLTVGNPSNPSNPTNPTDPTDPISNDYSVSVKDLSISLGDTGRITMNISSSNSCSYNFYLRVCDSSNNAVIDHEIFGHVNGASTIKYSISRLAFSSAGVYTIKIIRCTDGTVLDTAKLTVKEVTSDKYNLDDLVRTYDENFEFTIPISISPVNGINDTYYFMLRIYNEHGAKVFEENFGGSVVTRESIDFTVTRHIGYGDFIIQILNPNSGLLLNTAKLRMVVSTKIVASDVKTVYNGNKFLDIKLKTNNYYICNAKISLNLNGIKTFKIDEAGNLKVSTNGLKPKTYDVLISFDGSNNFYKSSLHVKIIVTKANPKLTASKKTFKVKVKTKKYTVTLKDNNRKAIKKAKLTLKVKGKTYKATTNSKGKATFKIKLAKKGTFKAVVKFKGNEYYKAVYKKFKIKIK